MYEAMVKGVLALQRGSWVRTGGRDLPNGKWAVGWDN